MWRTRHFSVQVTAAGMNAETGLITLRVHAAHAHSQPCFHPSIFWLCGDEGVVSHEGD